MANIIEFKGRHLTLSKLARESGLSFSLLSRRYKSGDRGDYLVRPVRSPIEVDYAGEVVSLYSASKLSGMSYDTLYARYMDGIRPPELFSKQNRNVGHEKLASKLNCDTATQIIVELREGIKTQKALAEEYNVSQSYVSLLKSGKRWTKLSLKGER